MLVLPPLLRIITWILLPLYLDGTISISIAIVFIPWYLISIMWLIIPTVTFRLRYRAIPAEQQSQFRTAVRAQTILVFFGLLVMWTILGLWMAWMENRLGVVSLFIPCLILVGLLIVCCGCVGCCLCCPPVEEWNTKGSVAMITDGGRTQLFPQQGNGDVERGQGSIPLTDTRQ